MTDIEQSLAEALHSLFPSRGSWRWWKWGGASGSDVTGLSPDFAAAILATPQMQAIARRLEADHVCCIDEIIVYKAERDGWRRAAEEYEQRWRKADADADRLAEALWRDGFTAHSNTCDGDDWEQCPYKPCRDTLAALRAHDEATGEE